MPSKPMPRVVEKFHIPLEGSLGILAYGYRGIMVWRQVRNDYAQNHHCQSKKVELKNEEV